MRLLFRAFLCVLIILFIGCKTVSVNQYNSKITPILVELGSIGIDKNILLKNNHIKTARPNYKEPIRVVAIAMPFSKRQYKAFLKAKALQTSNVNITYIDSLANKPKFINLQIIDRVALISELNSKYNTDIKNYLRKNSKATIVTSVSLALSPEDLDSITDADATFLVQNKLNSYTLQLYKKGKQTQTIFFNQGVVFAYSTSSNCWRENGKYQITIVDLVENTSSCPKKTYKSAQRAKQQIDYFKF